MSEEKAHRQEPVDEISLPSSDKREWEFSGSPRTLPVEQNLAPQEVLPIEATQADTPATEEPQADED